jgi:hypothetical protein
MKKLALVSAISLFAAVSVGSGLAQPPMPPPGAMPGPRMMPGPGMMPGMMRYGQHSMSGKVTKLDAATGMISVETKEGTLELHFPPPSLANVKVGDTMTVYLSFSMGEPGQVMERPGMRQMPEMPRMPEPPPAPKAE